MAKVINLRTVRKQKTRERIERLKEKQLAAQSGVKKLERDTVINLNDAAKRRLDAHLLKED